jgi:peptide/nickel transport system permease protein
MRYVVRRLLHGLVVLFGVSIIVFGLTWLTGDPASVLLPLDTPPERVADFRRALGLDQPPPVQYALFLQRAVTSVRPSAIERRPCSWWSNGCRSRCG